MENGEWKIGGLMHNAQCIMHNAQCTMHNEWLADAQMENGEWKMENADMGEGRPPCRPHGAGLRTFKCTMHNAQCIMHNA